LRVALFARRCRMRRHVHWQTHMHARMHRREGTHMNVECMCVSVCADKRVDVVMVCVFVKCQMQCLVCGYATPGASRDVRKALPQITRHFPCATFLVKASIAHRVIMRMVGLANFWS
jgi:hypothetical protein